MHQILEIASDVALIYYLICITVLLFYDNFDLLNIFAKCEFKLDISASVCWNFGKLSMSMVWGTVPMVNHSAVKVSILALQYKLAPSFVEIFSSL